MGSISECWLLSNNCRGGVPHSSGAILYARHGVWLVGGGGGGLGIVLQYPVGIVAKPCEAAVRKRMRKHL